MYCDRIGICYSVLISGVQHKKQFLVKKNNETALVIDPQSNMKYKQTVS